MKRVLLLLVISAFLFACGGKGESEIKDFVKVEFCDKLKNAKSQDEIQAISGEFEKKALDYLKSKEEMETAAKFVKECDDELRKSLLERSAPIN